MSLKRRKFLSLAGRLTGITIITPLTLIQGKPAVKCEDCKFYLPDLEVDGYDIFTGRNQRVGCKHWPCPNDEEVRSCYWFERGCWMRANRWKKIIRLNWPPKNAFEKNKTNKHNFVDAKKRDYCFIIGGLCKRIPCKYFLNKKASEEDAQKIVENVHKLLDVPLDNRKPLLQGESKFKTDLRCSTEYRLTWLGRLLGRLQIR